ncbi:unnamed protein product [Ceutorhynchus assimilis]|uniref:Uncharacterized protein n=1 Tax=Ceutorhynchus assimilis TaxID=467358 RepID=A0A9N9MKR8_9CUCU|nr:unnamed protein product [Ceutorhynchus assimilis]
MERQSVREHMMNLFDVHFRPALQSLSPDALRVLIFGLDAITNATNRQQVRQEIATFLEDITNSGEAVGVLSQGTQERTPRQNIEE